MHCSISFELDFSKAAATLRYGNFRTTPSLLKGCVIFNTKTTHETGSCSTINCRTVTPRQSYEAVGILPNVLPYQCGVRVCLVAHRQLQNVISFGFLGSKRKSLHTVVTFQ